MVITEQKIKKENSNKTNFNRARFSDNYKYIIDSSGKRVEFNDPRIVYVEPAARNYYGKRLIENYYKVHGKNIRFVDDTDNDTFQYAKKICSGRECVPTLAIAGGILKDVYENRSKNEITIYRNALEQEGPCQNGGWPALWDIFSKRLKIENVIFCASLGKKGKWMGLKFSFLEAQVILYILGHILTEAENTLHICAKNPEEALLKFEKTTNKLFGKVKNLRRSIKKGLIEWAKEISKIPLKTNVEDTPKVLIFGGLNLLFIHYPFEDYFLKNGIIPKVIDLTEGTYWIIYEWFMRYNFEIGRLKSKKQLNLAGLIYSLLFKRHKYDALKAIFAKIVMVYLDFKIKKIRKIIGKTGFLCDEKISFKKLIEESREYISCFVFNETLITTGRFIQSIKSGHFDGLINLGSFNCQPAMNSQAIIRPLANKSNIPYAAIDSEGPWISTNQLRLLETISVQAKRFRKEKKIC